MFPNIPRAYIIRELDRADGVVTVAIDKLLLIAPDFMNSNNDSSTTIDTTPVTSSAPSTHQSILNSIKSGGGAAETAEKATDDLTRRNWDEIDPGRKQAILAERKRSMLVRARESFLKRNQE